MAKWPPKPEIFVSLQPRHIRWKFQRQICRGFRLRLTRRNCPPSDCDNRNGDIDVSGANLVIPAVRRYSNHLATVCRGRKCRICRWNFDANSHNSRDISISGFGPPSLFSVVGRYCNHLPTLFSSSTSLQIPDVPLEFRCHLSVSEI